MPKRGRRGIPNLYKKHTATCRNRDPLKCDCPGTVEAVGTNRLHDRASSL